MAGTRVFAALVGITLLAGCSQLGGVPGAEAFPDASLRKVKSAEHWNVIAGDVAKQTAELKNRPELKGKDLYVSPAGDGSDFGRGFHAMLISHLVNSGANVATRPEGTIQVSYEAQVVRHLAGQGNYQPGTVAAIAGGVVVAREVSTSNASSSAKALEAAALIAGADFLAAKVRLLSATNTEVIITTSLIDNNKYLMRKTDVYFVEDIEGAMFEPPFRPRTKTMGVTGQ